MKTNRDIFSFILGCVTFGVMMAYRDAASTPLLRSLVAGVAFVVFGFTIRKFSASR